MQKEKELEHALKKIASSAPDFDLDLASCNKANPEDFFPDRNNPSWDRALSYCRKCPVQLECLVWAFTNKVSEGIWGGKTEEERKKMTPSQRGAVRKKLNAQRR